MAIDPVSLGVGGGLSLASAYFSGEAQKDAARIAAQAAQFRPIDITTGLGGISYGPQIDPETGQPIPGTEGVRTTLDPRLVAMQNQLFGMGGAGLDTLGSFDPNEQARLFTQQLTELAAPEEQRQRLQLENRLFKQGILGATPGAERMGALQQAQSMAGTQRALMGQEMGQQQQAQLFQQALGALQAGGELEQMGGMGLLPAFASIGGAATSAAGRGAEFGFQAGMNRADMLSSFFGNLGQGLAQYSFSPTPTYGMQAAQPTLFG